MTVLWDVDEEEEVKVENNIAFYNVCVIFRYMVIVCKYILLYRNQLDEWKECYEKLTDMVVPRSSK